MNGDILPDRAGRAGRARTAEQSTAFEMLRPLAEPFRFRVLADPEGFPVIPGRFGNVEFYCHGQLGVTCWSCPVPGEPALAIFTTRRRLHASLSAIPGLVRWQVGDDEFRGVFPPERLKDVATVIRAKRKRPPESAAHLQGLVRPPYRAGSEPQDRTDGPDTGKKTVMLTQGPDARARNPALVRVRDLTRLDVWSASPPLWQRLTARGWRGSGGGITGRGFMLGLSASGRRPSPPSSRP